MREFTDIEITDPGYEVASVMNEKFIELRFDGDERKLFSYGRPISLVNDKTVRLSTQGYYTGVGLKLTAAGTKLNLIDGKRDIFARGTINNRFFKKAKKEDWQTKEELSPSGFSVHKTEIILSAAEKSYLEYGLTPLQMEDKWFIYFENNSLHFFRSWTGIEIFEAFLRPIENGRWIIKEFRAKTGKEYSSVNDDYTFRSLVKSRINRMTRLLE